MLLHEVEGGVGVLEELAAGRPRTGRTPWRAVDADDVTDAVLAGSWVVDLRSRARFAHGHLPGTVNVEHGPDFASSVGWLLPWEDDLVLLADEPRLAEAAVADLARRGIPVAGAHVLTAGSPLTAHYRRCTWADLPDPHDASTRPVLLDVRPHDDWRDGHLPGSLSCPVQQVADRAAHLPAGELWVHCGSGRRAAVAASLLHRLGRRVVHVDDAWARVAHLAVTDRGRSAA